MTRATSSRKQLVANLKVSDLRAMITEIVRQVVREETQRDYSINEHGIKVLSKEEDIDPDYARQLNEDYAAILSGKAELVSSDQIEEELRQLGVPL